LFSSIILQLAASGFERFADGYVNVFVRGRDLLFFPALFDSSTLDRAAQTRLVLHDDLAARNGQIDPDVKSLSLLAVLVRDFDHHPASIMLS
jgi:hypothetical protein